MAREEELQREQEGKHDAELKKARHEERIAEIAKETAEESRREAEK
jgi:hypothetical protein